MIHAHLFLCKIRDSDHGPKFQATMKDINESSIFDPYRPSDGYQISIFHTMHAEVDSYRTHHWKVRVDGIVSVILHQWVTHAVCSINIDCNGRQVAPLHSFHSAAQSKCHRLASMSSSGNRSTCKLGKLTSCWSFIASNFAAPAGAIPLGGLLRFKGMLLI